MRDINPVRFKYVTQWAHSDRQ